MLEKEDRQQRRLVAIIALLVVLLVASNIFWIYEWNQYDYEDVGTETEETSVELDAEGGNANYIGRNGKIINGTSEGNIADDSHEIEKAH
jgi:hypothetical protein